MRPNDYTSLQGWMYDMGLNLSELITYAVIYGFSWDGHSCFRGTVEQIGQFSLVKPRQARDILARLERRGLITRKEVPGKVTEYTVVLPVPRCAGVDPGSVVPPAVECRPPGSGVPPTPAVECRPNNNKINNIITIDNPPILPRAREDADLIAYGDHVRMTAAEHGKLVARFGAQDTDRLCEILDGYLDNPKRTNRYRSHYRAILGWVVTRLQEEKLTAQRMENAKVAAQRAQGIQQAPEGFGRAAADAKRRLEELFAKNQ